LTFSFANAFLQHNN